MRAILWWISLYSWRNSAVKQLQFLSAVPVWDFAPQVFEFTCRCCYGSVYWRFVLGWWWWLWGHNGHADLNGKLKSPEETTLTSSIGCSRLIRLPPSLIFNDQLRAYQFYLPVEKKLDQYSWKLTILSFKVKTQTNEHLSCWQIKNYDK